MRFVMTCSSTSHPMRSDVAVNADSLNTAFAKAKRKFARRLGIPPAEVAITSIHREAGSWVQVNTEIRDEHIKKAERILVDNGIDADEASIVLQALGYALLDVELYPS